MYIYSYICISCVYIYSYICIYVYIYIHTHLHIERETLKCSIHGIFITKRGAPLHGQEMPRFISSIPPCRRLRSLQALPLLPVEVRLDDLVNWDDWSRCDWDNLDLLKPQEMNETNTDSHGFPCPSEFLVGKVRQSSSANQGYEENRHETLLNG